MRNVLIVLVALVVWLSCKTKPAATAPVSNLDPAMFDKKWKTIDSLEQKGLISSALEEVKTIKQLALSGKNAEHLVKAITYENKYLIQLEEDSVIKALQRLEAEINTYPEPAKSVMHSLAASWYGNYLQTHLWELRNRTEFEGTPGEDIRTWGIRHFVDRIASHYNASVQWDGLKTARVEDFPVLLTEKQNTDDLRPTLYDILMHRALDFYAGTEAFLTKPVYEFVLTDPDAFAPARNFINISFPSRDSLSNTWQALQWFRELLSFRLSDNQHEAALVDADLKRLRFVHEHIIIDQKDSLYLLALENLRKQHATHPESALIDYYRAELMMRQASEWVGDRESPFRYHYNKALEICREAIRNFPDAYGSQLCKTLITQIESKTINAQIESVNLPGEELLAQLEFRNINAVQLKLIKLPQAPRRWRGENWDGEDILTRLNLLTAQKTWSQQLNDGGDHQPHQTEIALPSLALGHYALVISDREDFDVKTSTTGTIMFTVSELGYWYIDDRQSSQVAAIINRNTGQPMQGVKAEFISFEYNPNRRRQEELKLGEATSDANGWVTVPAKENKTIQLYLTKGDDELFEDEGYHTYRYGRDYTSDKTTLFFSDRAIYRPGQKMYFKGYVLDFDRYRIPKIVDGKTVEVVLYDANSQEQMRKTFVSNAYGTFSGHFDIPAGGLSGQMSISSSHGNVRHYFQVEEYKRPKFEVTFDTLRETARINETVTLKGFAKDYAGSSVPNADVRYRVERVAYRPWWHMSYRKGFWPREDDRQVLATGNTKTDEMGGFTISFKALPKSGGDKFLHYRYETTAFVTDVTGESHELTKTISLNEQGYEVNIGLNERQSIENIRKVAVSAFNSDGADVKVSGEVSISSLSGPSTHKRDRLWPNPDILTLSESDYNARFPDYFVPGRESMDQWSVLSTIGTRSFTVNGSDTINLGDLINKPGYYKLSWTWRDVSGKDLKIEQFVMVYDESKTLPGAEIIQVAYDDIPYEPGKSVEVDLLTGIQNPPKTIRLVEKRASDMVRTWWSLPTYNDKTINISESDRGGVYMHYLTAYNNRFIRSTHLIQVPWTNKDLDVTLKTWRDKLEPGDEETWTMTVQGPKKEAVTAEMLLSMYDASLDAFMPHQWRMQLYPSTMSRIGVSGSVTRPAAYWGLTHNWRDNFGDVPYRQYRDINTYGYYPEGGMDVYYRRYKNVRNATGNAPEMLEMQSDAAAPPATVQATGSSLEDQEEARTPTTEESTPPSPSLRTALDETVFFFPQITTDEKGNVSFSFKMKEGLTRWKFQALAHTKDLSFGLTQAEIVTQKQLMVFPNPPRFFREGDTIAFQIKTTNLTTEALAGSTQLKIIDAVTNEDVSAQWKINTSAQSQNIIAGGSTPASWTLIVPKNWVKPVKYQVTALAGSFTDGEEAMIPVVTNRILITETLPLPVKANEKRTFVFKSMQNNSATRDHHQYVVEMTTSPAWYAVQALPYLMENQHEGAEAIFSRLYANSLGSHIAQKYPSIRQVYDAWRNANDDALLSNLEKNQDLKSAILEETPWVRDAMGETAQKKDIALLFETNRMRNETQQAITSLSRMQLSNGGWSWFPGGRDHWYITQYIVEGFGHLSKMGISFQRNGAQQMIYRAVPYLDSRMTEWYDELKRQANKGTIKLEDQQISSLQIHYLYTRSFFPDVEHTAKLDEVMKYVRTQAEKYWLQMSIYDQGMLALGLFRENPANALSKTILASVREKTIVDDELGRYWKQTPGYYWYQAPVETQSLMIELYQDMKVPQSEIDELRVWLLKQKQTTRWKSSKATATAIYALLIHPDTWLESKGIVEVSIGNTSVINATSTPEAGTGYVKESWDGDDIKDNWSTVTVQNPNNHIAWGAVYWQYWEDIDKVKTSVDENPLSVTRSLLTTKQTDRGVVTNEAILRNLKVGDKLIVRLTIETDRPMEFVHLKDVRASGFEPLDVISGYRWGGGVGYFQSTKDLATHFFIDYLPRGKYVIEYPVTVAQAGAYSEGLATLQCFYAPEFGDHSEGRRVQVTGNQ